MNERAVPLFDALSSIANLLSRQALEADPATAARLAGIAGRCVEFDCTLPPVQCHVQITEQGINTVPGPADQPDAIVQGTATDLATWLLPTHPGNVTVHGDEALLIELRSILSQYQPDLAGPLNSIVGEQTAAALLGSAEMGLKGLRSLFEGVGQSMQQQAAGQFISRDQIDQLLDGIDELRLRIDRLAAGVTQAEKAHQQPPR